MAQNRNNRKSRVIKNLKAEKDRKVPLSVTVSNSVRDELKAWCSKNDLKESQAVNEILKDFLFENS